MEGNEAWDPLWFNFRLGDEEAKLYGITVGEASAQGVVETLAAVQAVKLWGSLVEGEAATLEVRSDSVVALAVLGKLANATPSLNFLGAELALALETHSIQGLKCVHIPGCLNDCADYLSRMAAPGALRELPSDLRKVVIRALPARDAGWYRLPPPGLNPGLWGERAGLAVLANAM